jgi:DHA3 family macrolide efflux protein-like MFS transporter
MYRRLFRSRNFMALWFGQMVSFIGDYFVWLAIPIVVNRLTGSAMMVGLAAISSALPALVLGPVAGVFVDRWDRRRTMIISDLVRAGLVLFCLLVHTREQVWIFYVVGFLMSSTSQFFYPARGALLPLIVTDPEDWLSANGLMQIIQTVGMLAGPALAGFAIGIWGERVAFMINCAGFLISAGAVYTIRMRLTPPVATSGPTTAKNIWGDLREGILYLFGSRTLVGILVCMSVIMLGLGAINVIWVPYLQRTFNVGATGLGLVDSSQGLGMVVGGVLLGFIAARVKKKILVSTGIAVAGFFLAANGLAPAFPYIVGFSFMVGLAIVPAQSGLNTIMQMAVPDVKRGRVGSSLNAISTAASLVSMAFAAILGEWIGLRTVYVVFGSIVMLSGLLGFWLIQEPKSAILTDIPPANTELLSES